MTTKFKKNDRVEVINKDNLCHGKTGIIREVHIDEKGPYNHEAVVSVKVDLDGDSGELWFSENDLAFVPQVKPVINGTYRITAPIEDVNPLNFYKYVINNDDIANEQLRKLTIGTNIELPTATELDIMFGNNPNTNGETTEGTKKDGGKPRIDLIDPDLITGLADIMTSGSDKYDTSKDVYDSNWRKGMRWGRVYASLQRHLQAFWSGEDFDPESGKPHLYHAAANIMMLNHYRRSFPQGDDRDVPWRTAHRIGLDIDGVLCNTYDRVMADAHEVIRGPEKNGEMVHYPFNDRLIYALHNLTYDDWYSLPTIESGRDLPFEPVVYVTARRGVALEAARDWLEDNGFPYAPVVSSGHDSKVPLLREHDVTLFVDDKFEQFQDINNAGIACYLYDRIYNRKHNVGYRRIFRLADLLNPKRTYDAPALAA